MESRFPDTQSKISKKLGQCGRQIYASVVPKKLGVGVEFLTLLGLGLIKINDVSANFNNPRPSLILNN